MATAAVLIVGSSESLPESSPDFQDLPESLSGCPLPCVEVLGRSTLDRTLESLRESNVNPITLVGTEGLMDRLGSAGPFVEKLAAHHSEAVWPLATRKMAEDFAAGTQTVLLQRLGGYIEFDLADMLQFHEDRGKSVCRAADEEGLLDLWVVDQRIAANENFSDWQAQPACTYRRCHYVNRLRSIRELRQLVVDGLRSRCSFRPVGTEVRPGVWMGEQAHVHREARVVAPAYIGRRAKVNAAGLVTRSSSLERDCEVGEATVVEDASILADTHLGRWLDVSHAVVDGNTFVDLRSEVAVEIADGALVGRTKASESRLWLGESEHLTFVKRVSGRVKKALLH